MVCNGEIDDDTDTLWEFNKEGVASIELEEEILDDPEITGDTVEIEL
jgi:hypothetical protein